MPYKIVKSDKPRGWFVVKESDNTRMSDKPHKTKLEAIAQMQAIGISKRNQLIKQKYRS
jgi:hypothetical protein